VAINPKKQEMPTQAPETRARNFDEVALGYTAEMAVGEAERCLACKNQPCVAGCPVIIHIPDFITLMKIGDFEGAYREITKSSSTCRLRPCVPPGNPVRKQVYAGHKV